MRTLITAASLWDGPIRIANPVLEIEDGRIAALYSQSQRPIPPGVPVRHFPGATVAPAFFDIHIHGAAGHDVMEATPEALAAIGQFLASRGTARYLATTVTAPLDSTLRSLSGLAKLINQPQLPPASAQPPMALPIGIHLEGPFISHQKRGVHPPAHLLAPSIPTFDRLFEAAEGHIRLLTLAPELPQAAELTAHATARGVRVSIGHSNATAAETHPVLAAGAASATHTFNAMRPLDHREPGILGLVLTTDSLYAELICDGIHVAPELVKLWFRAKPNHRAILVTDAMSATGMPEGQYQLGPLTVQVANGRATANGVLAGSVLTLDRALENFLAYTSATLPQALPLLTTNPHNLIHHPTPTEVPHLTPNSPANLVVLTPEGQLQTTLIAGQLAT